MLTIANEGIEQAWILLRCMSLARWTVIAMFFLKLRAKGPMTDQRFASGFQTATNGDEGELGFCRGTVILSGDGTCDAERTSV